MKIYIATGYKRREEHNEVRDALTGAGHTLTHDWTTPENRRLPACKAALADKQGIQDADLLIVLLPGGMGTHTELGIALALGKPVLVYALDPKDLPRSMIFLYHPLVTRIRGALSSLLDHPLLRKEGE